MIDRAVECFLPNKSLKSKLIINGFCLQKLIRPSLLLRARYFCFIVLNFCIWGLSAQETINVGDALENYFISSKQLTFFEDTSNSLTIQEIVAGKYDQQFRQQSFVMAKNINPSATYWTKMNLEGEGLLTKDWYLEFLVARTQQIQFFWIDEQGQIHASNLSGTNYPFKQKPFAHKNFLYDLPKQKELTVYIKIQTDYLIHLTYYLRSKSYQLQYALTEYYFLGLFYGALILLCIYNLILFSTLRRWIYFFFSLYGIACMLLFSMDDGLAFQFVWPNWPWINYLIHLLAIPFFMLTFTMYFSAYFDLKKSRPQFYKKLIGVAVFLFIAQFLDTYFFETQNVTYLYLCLFTFFLVYAADSAFKGYKPAQFFILAYSFTFTGLCLFFFRTNGFLDINWNSIFLVYLFNFGVLFELTLLSLAQAYKLRFDEKAANVKLQNQFKELQSKKEKLQLALASNDELQNFAHIVSHDLRQPIRNIKTYSTLLSRDLNKKGALSENQEELLHLIDESTLNMNDFVLSLLDYAKLGSSSKSAVFSLGTVVEKSVHNLREQIKEKKAEIICENGEIELLGSEVKFVQLFQNLMSNSIKFARTGVAPKIVIKAAIDKKGQIKISIQDNGKGIEQKYLDKIFEVLFKIHEHHSVDGFGIGLASCKKIVERHDGQIRVESKLNQGTIFIIDLPKVEIPEPVLT